MDLMQQTKMFMVAAESEIRKIDGLLNNCSLPYSEAWKIKDTLNTALSYIVQTGNIIKDVIANREQQKAQKQEELITWAQKIVEEEEKRKAVPQAPEPGILREIPMPDGTKLEVIEKPASPEVIDSVVLPGQGAILQEGRE